MIAVNDTIKFAVVPSHLVNDIWDSVKRFVISALEFCYDDTDEFDLKQAIINNKLLLVVITDNDKIVSSVTIEVSELRGKKVCHIFTLGGEDIDTWINQFMEVWRAIALEQNCDFISMKGRPGWQRYAKKHGFTHQYTQMIQDIRGQDNGRQ